ncbi:hypothetical protein DXU77_23860 [Pseudomonas lactis]|nr:hypothetical protein [Pseudomonas lactis]
MMPSQILGAAPGSLRAAQAPDQQVVFATQDQQHTKELSDAQRNQGACATSLLLLIAGWLSVFLWDSVSGCNELTTRSAIGVVHTAVEQT